MGIQIKKIQAQETYNLRHEVMWPDQPIEFIKLKNDEEGIHFGLFKNSTIVSVISIFIKNDAAQFRKFATKTSEQGNGYGATLLNHIIKAISNEEKVKKLWCNARVDKTSYYEKFGMTKTTKRFTKENINYILMEKTFPKID